MAETAVTAAHGRPDLPAGIGAHDVLVEID
jgi:hypothetical protein